MVILRDFPIKMHSLRWFCPMTPDFPGISSFFQEKRKDVLVEAGLKDGPENFGAASKVRQGWNLGDFLP